MRIGILAVARVVAMVRVADLEHQHPVAPPRHRDLDRAAIDDVVAVTGADELLSMRDQVSSLRIEDERTRLAREATGGGRAGAAPAEIKSVMPGVVKELRVAEGDPVAEGQALRDYWKIVESHRWLLATTVLLGLLAALVSVAGMYAFLGADFLVATQVIVYVGGILSSDTFY